jgi:hypothetical protein
MNKTLWPQVLRLEQENGRLMMESQQNDALRGQIRQLQEDIRKDTDLRRELLAAVAMARLGSNFFKGCPGRAGGGNPGFFIFVYFFVTQLLLSHTDSPPTTIEFTATTPAL